MNIDSIHWHDCLLVSAVEIPVKDCLIFNVKYPEDWELDVYEDYSIVFNGFHSLVIDEIPFEGSPTILSASIEGADERNGTIIIVVSTNAGTRIVKAKKVSLVPGFTFS